MFIHLNLKYWYLKWILDLFLDMRLGYHRYVHHNADNHIVEYFELGGLKSRKYVKNIFNGADEISSAPFGLETGMWW